MLFNFLLISLVRELNIKYCAKIDMIVPNIKCFRIDTLKGLTNTAFIHPFLNLACESLLDIDVRAILKNKDSII